MKGKLLVNVGLCVVLLISLWVTGCSPSTKDRYLEIWEIAHEEGQYEKAIIEFQKFIEDHPEGEWSTNARLQIGDCFLNLKNEVQARKYFEEVVQINWDPCTTDRALACLEHLDSNHQTEYPLHLSGKCPICRE